MIQLLLLSDLRKHVKAAFYELFPLLAEVAGKCGAMLTFPNQYHLKEADGTMDAVRH